MDGYRASCKYLGIQSRTAMSLRGRRRYADLRTQKRIGTDVDATKDIDFGTGLKGDLTASRTRKAWTLPTM